MGRREKLLYFIYSKGKLTRTQQAYRIMDSKLQRKRADDSDSASGKGSTNRSSRSCGGFAPRSATDPLRPFYYCKPKSNRALPVRCPGLPPFCRQTPSVETFPVPGTTQQIYYDGISWLFQRGIGQAIKRGHFRMKMRIGKG